MGRDFYDAFVLPYSGIIIKLCRLYTNSQEDFEDYYQEVCLQIWRSKDSFKQQSEWSTWVYKVALNVCLTYLKKAKKGQHKFVSDTLEPQDMEAQDTSNCGDIESLYLAIHQLSEIDRAIILLYLEEKSNIEIADIIGSNANNIGVRVSRIKTKLNKILKLEGESNE